MEILAGGRDADVFRYTDGLVLRRYRDGRSVEAEGGLMRELATLGYPVPMVESADGADLVMEHVDGPTMAAQLVHGELDATEGGVLLAQLHDHLHGLPRPDRHPLLHLDLHPFNVLMSSRGPVVIDWSNARTGPAGLDAAMTALILAQVATLPQIVAELPDLAPLTAADGGARLPGRLTSFLRAFVSTTSAPLVEHLVEAEALRRGDRYQSTAELDRLDDAVALVRSLA